MFTNQILSASSVVSLKNQEEKQLASIQVVDELEIYLKKLEEEFKQLTSLSQDKKKWDSLTQAEQIKNEKEKFAIIMKVYNSIEKHYGKTSISSHFFEKPKKKVSFWRKLLFSFLIGIDILLMTVGGFLGSLQLLQIMAPNLSFIGMILIASVATGIESLMIYAMFKPMLQQGMGIPAELPQETIGNHTGKRLQLLEKLNTKIINNSHYTYEQNPKIYNYYASILKIFNRDMKKTELLPFKESTFKKVGRCFLSGLNFCLSIAGSYFGTVMFLAVASPMLIGTPIGWGIIATLIVAQLLTRLFIRQNSTFNLLNPSAHHHEIVRKKLSHFKDKTDGIDYDIKTMAKLNKINKVEIKKTLLKKSIYNLKTQECPASFKPGESLSARAAAAHAKPNIAATNSRAQEYPVFFNSRKLLLDNTDKEIQSPIAPNKFPA